MNYGKIVHIESANFSTYYNYCYVKSLADEGVDTELLTAEYIYESIRPPDNVKVIYFFSKASSFFNTWLRSQTFRRFLRSVEYPFNLITLFIKLVRDKAEVVHYNSVALPFIDLLFFKLLRSIGIKIVYTAHNPFPHESKPWHRWEYKNIYNTVDHIIVLTEYVKKTILENTDVRPQKITVIPHGDYDYLLSQVRPNIELKNELERKVRSCKVLSFFGVIRPYKGLEYLLEAFALVREKVSNVKLCVFGRCYMTNQNCYIDLASRLKLGDSVIFDFRYIPLPDLMAYLDMTHLAVLPYVDASQSGNIVMLYKKGIPVIATNVGGLPEMVVNGKSGIIIPPKDVLALAEGIIDILKDEDKRQEMAKFANDLAEKEYSWKKIAKKTIEEVYERI